VVRLQQIATGGNVNPSRGGQPSVRNTESSTQAVINAVYVQVLGNAGYAGERMGSDEARLENGDISLRDFVRCVARSDAFRRRYWSGLYIVKAIEVMHRRLLGRPTFGRWEIDALFDTAARKGFYGVVDALINSQEYNESFGEDTVPFERFITPGDLSVRRTPTFKQEVKSFGYDSSGLVLGNRPEPTAATQFRSSGSVTKRNLKGRSQGAPQGWSTMASRFSQGPDLVKSLRQIRLGESIPSRASRSRSKAAAPLTPMTGALAIQGAEGYKLRGGLPANLTLNRPCDESELLTVIDATYRQLLNRIPLDSERLWEAESRLRNDDINLNGFIESVALSESFQDRLYRMAPLRAASAASLALLGRAATPSEVSRFLTVRAESGQPTAVMELVEQRPDGDEVPRTDGMNTRSGVSQATLQRTAALYRGSAGMTPPTDSAI
jgi:phycobilisome core-membrane linker protein